MTRPNTDPPPGSPGVVGLDDVVRVLRRGAVFALLLAFVAAGTAYYLASVAPPVYEAQVGVIASQPGGAFGGLAVVSPPSVDPSVYHAALTQGDVVANALTRLRGERPSDAQVRAFLRTMRIRVDDAQRSGTVWISVRDGDPAFAADAVNRIAEELVAWDRARARSALDRSVAALEASVAELDAEAAAATAAGDAGRAALLTATRDQRAQELAAAEGIRSQALVVGLLEPLRTVTPPQLPVGPRGLFDTVVAFVVGLVLGYGLQIARWALRKRIGGRDDVAAVTDLPVLAEFARRSRRAPRTAPEAAGFLHAHVALATRDEEVRVLLVTSATTPGEKDDVGMALAERFARSGARTLLVDADLRHATTTGWLDLAPNGTPSFERYLDDPAATFAPIQVMVGRQVAYDFVPGRIADGYPVDLLNEGLSDRLASWRARYDVIVLDAAPLLPHADTLTLAASCTGLLLCARAGRTDRSDLAAAVQQLERTRLNVLGVVLTGTPPNRARDARRHVEPATPDGTAGAASGPWARPRPLPASGRAARAVGRRHPGP